MHGRTFGHAKHPEKHEDGLFVSFLAQRPPINEREKLLLNKNMPKNIMLNQLWNVIDLNYYDVSHINPVIWHMFKSTVNPKYIDLRKKAWIGQCMIPKVPEGVYRGDIQAIIPRIRDQPIDPTRQPPKTDIPKNYKSTIKDFLSHPANHPPPPPPNPQFNPNRSDFQYRTNDSMPPSFRTNTYMNPQDESYESITSKHRHWKTDPSHRSSRGHRSPSYSQSSNYEESQQATDEDMDPNQIISESGDEEDDEAAANARAHRFQKMNAVNRDRLLANYHQIIKNCKIKGILPRIQISNLEEATCQQLIAAINDNQIGYNKDKWLKTCRTIAKTAGIGLYKGNEALKILPLTPAGVPADVAEKDFMQEWSSTVEYNEPEFEELFHIIRGKGNPIPEPNPLRDIALSFGNMIGMKFLTNGLGLSYQDLINIPFEQEKDHQDAINADSKSNTKSQKTQDKAGLNVSPAASIHQSTTIQPKIVENDRKTKNIPSKPTSVRNQTESKPMDHKTTKHNDSKPEVEQYDPSTIASSSGENTKTDISKDDKMQDQSEPSSMANETVDPTHESLPKRRRTVGSFTLPPDIDV